MLQQLAQLETECARRLTRIAELEAESARRGTELADAAREIHVQGTVAQRIRSLKEAYRDTLAKID